MTDKPARDAEYVAGSWRTPGGKRLYTAEEVGDAQASEAALCTRGLEAELRCCQRAKQLDEHQIDILNAQCRRLWDALKSLAGLDDSQVEYIAHNDGQVERSDGGAVSER